jgi:hypothetical protein
LYEGYTPKEALKWLMIVDIKQDLLLKLVINLLIALVVQNVFDEFYYGYIHRKEGLDGENINQ